MKIYIYGDSNTEGYDPFGYPDYFYPEESIWPRILQRELGDGFQVVSDGVCGRCIPDEGYPMDLLVRRMRREMPIDIFAVMLGTNDYLNMRQGDVRIVAESMRLFVTELREKFAEEESQSGNGNALPEIIIIYPPRIRIPGLSPLSFQEQDEAWRKAFSAVCEKTGCIMADATSLELPLAADGVHLSMEGHKMLGERAAEFVRHFAGIDK